MGSETKIFRFFSSAGTKRNHAPSTNFNFYLVRLALLFFTVGNVLSGLGRLGFVSC